MTHDEPLVELLFDRLAADGVPDDVADVVLGAVGGDDDLRAALDGRTTRLDPAGDGPATRPAHLYLDAVTVAGFRGVGPRRTLAVRPGPGLTLVVGRNGSGKSSFAEAIELALTGDSARWADRNSVWRSGWRNLHQPDACAIALDLRMDGQATPTRIRRAWPAEGELTDATVSVSSPEGESGGLDTLGLARPLRLYRPFLTAGDLGRLVTSTSTALHDSVNGILGLELLTETDRRLQAAAKPGDALLKDLRERRLALRAGLDQVDDDRARRAARLLAATSPDLDELDSVLAEPVGGDTDRAVALHRRLAELALPDPAVVARLSQELAAFAEESRGYEERQVKASVRTAELLRLAMDHHADNGDGPCPVCRTGALDGAWREQADLAFRELRDLSLSANRAASQITELTRRARQLTADLDPPAGGALDLAGGDGAALALLRDAVAALRLLPGAPAELAAHLADRYPAVAQAAELVREESAAYLRERDTAWQAVAGELRAWAAAARREPALQAEQARLKAARAWLKRTADEIRNARLAPFAAHSQQIWRWLRQESNVEFGGMTLQGSGTRRSVVFNVSVDGADNGTALGVMSQGELQALGLATFLPRSCAAESPFRFVVIDDPVQSMDPAKVDGLARVLADLAADRQVLVFTHDSRLPDAVRRLEIDAQILEVVRAERSVVTVREAADPVSRYLSDADAVALSRDVPDEVRAPVVAELCRSALEAACHRVVWRVRAARGEPVAATEAALDRAGSSVAVTFALALFDDPGRGDEVLRGLNNRFGRGAGDAYQACRKGVHGHWQGDLPGLVRQVRRITEGMR
ncbi:AAA family ATPase [Catellatospora sp. NPDC049609]|uniref:AAA family ATPase n=1 Tax=Catellatospora sp. NPDC049609 TaxID=3155505 RepID=UPI003440311E